MAPAAVIFPTHVNMVSATNAAKCNWVLRSILIRFSDKRNSSLASKASDAGTSYVTGLVARGEPAGQKRMTNPAEGCAEWAVAFDFHEASPKSGRL